jgi:inhibitor of cysteine peptidase
MVLGSVACGGGGHAADPAANDTQDELRTSGAVNVGDDDDGKTITVEKGKDLKLSLSSNATTGYKWSVKSTDRSFGYPSPQEGTYERGSDDGRIGSGGKQIFVWKTGSPFIEAGGAAHKVRLEYRRSFEDMDMPAAKTFSFSVKVKAPGAADDDQPAARECPTSHSINCMPPTTSDYCKSDFRSWAEANCDVSYLD